jgi:hypothetical protein
MPLHERWRSVLHGAAESRPVRRNGREDWFLTFALNVLVSAVVISFVSWLSGRLPTAAGFIMALPLASMLVLPLSFHQHGSAETSILLAKSIFIAVPISLTFFLPFLLSDRLHLSFWQAYAFGCLALPMGFFVHRVVSRAFFS